MVGRGELTDRAWAQLAPLLPRTQRRGGRWRDRRGVINGTLWKLRTGAPWRDLPERYGPWKTCYDRFVRWRQDGTWDRLLANAQTRSDAVGELNGSSASAPAACVPTSTPLGPASGWPGRM